ncbi:hypothetical protein TNCV_1734611 [Trichonephila clavipes]|nr:hypothetical protein TNCV_1734611 [Trichonephila clavipes]
MTSMLNSGFEPKPTRLQGECHNHHSGWGGIFKENVVYPNVYYPERQISEPVLFLSTFVNLEGEKDFNDDHREEITDLVQSIPGFQERGEDI